MTEFNPYNTLVRPLLTERSTILKEKFNQYVFEVVPSASKPEIKKAVEQLFKVKVEKVRTMNVLGQDKRMGRSVGKRPDWKKSIVKLAEGQKIDLVEQAG
ncbi:MAG: 50S ribosomal protein L23 [Elusimicrobia bacterium]|nr:50S ribosomal protein L23 [Elusimicrobiota bacterium]